MMDKHNPPGQATRLTNDSAAANPAAVSDTTPHQLTRGKLLARNTVYNLSGQFAPFVFAFFAVPTLLHAIGPDRFGILTLSWSLIGYANFFDLGIGRAITKMVAEKLGKG